MSMGRRRTINLDLPPRMARKGRAYYHVASVGLRQWKPLGGDKALALLKWAELEGRTDVRTFGNALDRFLAECLDGLAENTKRNYRQSAKALRQVFGDAPVAQITPQHVAEYLDRYPSKQSANAQVLLMSVVFEKLMRWGWTDRNPARGIRRNPRAPRTRYLTDEEFHALRNAACPLVRAVMDLSYLTGLRQSDVLKIRRDDIRDGLYVVQKKTGRKQVYSLTAELQAAIDQAKAIKQPVGSLYLISNRRGKPYTQPRFQYFWMRDFAKTGIEDVVFHDIRAKAATDAKALGMDYQALLGHANRNMSDQYVKLRETDRVSPLPMKL